MNGVQAVIFGGSAMILLALALRLFLKKHLPHRVFPALWCLCALRLLLPITIPSHLSIWNLLHTSVAAQADGVISDVLTPFPSLATNSTAKPAADIDVYKRQAWNTRRHSLQRRSYFVQAP